MATNLTNAKVYYFQPRTGVCGNQSTVGPWDPVPWGPFNDTTGNPYLEQSGINNAYGVSEGYVSSDQFQTGSPLPHIVRLTIVPTNTYEVVTTGEVDADLSATTWNMNSTQQVWDGTYTEVSWQTYETLFNAGDPNAEAQLSPNLVDVQGYWTIDSKKITISGWEGSDFAFSGPNVFTTSNPGNLVSCGYEVYGQDYTTVGFAQFQGTLYGNESVPQTAALSDYVINGGLLYNYGMNYMYPAATVDGSNTIGKYGVFKEMNGESQTETSSYRLFSPAGNPGYSNTNSFNLSKGDANFDTSLVAVAGANDNLYDNWPEHVQRVVLMNTLGVDSDGFGLEGNMVHAYIFHKIGATVLDDFTLEIDFDGEAEFIITDPDFEFTETELLSNQEDESEDESESEGDIL